MLLLIIISCMHLLPLNEPENLFLLFSFFLFKYSLVDRTNFYIPCTEIVVDDDCIQHSAHKT